jgi:hypothetical protein
MKDIVVNSVLIHLIVVMVFVSFAAASGGSLSYALALFYICLTLKHAIDIADFEMSN